MVDGGRGARLEEERQVDACRDEDDERVEGDLSEQERPVVGERIAQRLARERGRTRPLVEEADQRAHHVVCGPLVLTPQKLGPTGPEKLPPALRKPS